MTHELTPLARRALRRLADGKPMFPDTARTQATASWRRAAVRALFDGGYVEHGNRGPVPTQKGRDATENGRSLRARKLREKVLRMFQAGVTRADIAAELGINRGYVEKITWEAGIRDNVPWSEHDLDVLRLHYKRIGYGVIPMLETPRAPRYVSNKAWQLGLGSLKARLMRTARNRNSTTVEAAHP